VLYRLSYCGKPLRQNTIFGSAQQSLRRLPETARPGRTGWVIATASFEVDNEMIGRRLGRALSLREKASFRREGPSMKQAGNIQIPESLNEVCDPKRLALVIYDMQIGILKQIKNPAEIIGRVSKVLDAARAAGVRVVFMRHMSLPKELMGTFQYRMAMAWQRTDDPSAVNPWFPRDSPGFGITPELKPAPGEAILDKITMSAFEGTPLAIALRDCGITAVALVGVAMEIGIEPTARHAADLGIIPVVVTDACGCGNADAAVRSIEALKFAGDAILTDTDAFCAALAR
jgi:biuret amidohydrolase